jgi:hypothetical protein
MFLRIAALIAAASATAAIGLSSPVALAPQANAQTLFVMCPDGLEGIVGGHTSCPFAQNVRQAFYSSGMSHQIAACSPITGECYDMDCEGEYPAHFVDGETHIATRCDGGENAEVVIW